MAFFMEAECFCEVGCDSVDGSILSVMLLLVPKSRIFTTTTLVSNLNCVCVHCASAQQKHSLIWLGRCADAPAGFFFPTLDPGPPTPPPSGVFPSKGFVSPAGGGYLAILTFFFGTKCRNLFEPAIDTQKSVLWTPRGGTPWVGGTVGLKTIPVPLPVLFSSPNPAVCWPHAAIPLISPTKVRTQRHTVIRWKSDGGKGLMPGPGRRLTYRGRWNHTRLRRDWWRCGHPRPPPPTVIHSHATFSFLRSLSPCAGLHTPASARCEAGVSWRWPWAACCRLAPRPALAAAAPATHQCRTPLRACVWHWGLAMSQPLATLAIRLTPCVTHQHSP